MTEYEDCGHGRHVGAYCHQCEMKKILDWEGDYVGEFESMKDEDHADLMIAEKVECPVCLPSEQQIGGDHYKSMKIQPGYFSFVNGLNNCQSEAINYICRYKEKGGKQDLEKAIHYLNLLIEWEYAGSASEKS